MLWETPFLPSIAGVTSELPHLLGIYLDSRVLTSGHFTSLLSHLSLPFFFFFEAGSYGAQAGPELAVESLGPALDSCSSLPSQVLSTAVHHTARGLSF